MDKSMRTKDFLCGLDFPTLQKPEFVLMYSQIMGFPGGAVAKSLPASARDSGNTRDASSIPGSGRSSGEGNGYPLQYSCLDNSMEREAWQATDHGVTKSQTWLSARAHTHTHTHRLTVQCWFYFSCRKKKYFNSFLFLRFLSLAVRLAFSSQGHTWRHSFIYQLEKGGKCLKAWKTYNMQRKRKNITAIMPSWE